MVDHLDGGVQAHQGSTLESSTGRGTILQSRWSMSSKFPFPAVVAELCIQLGEPVDLLHSGEEQAILVQ